MLPSSVIYDQYDDPDALLVREHLKSGIPALWKTAAIRPIEEIPDQSFALVIRNGYQSQRKYAMDTRANADISAFYFMHRGGILPPQAQKVAAARLAFALENYGLSVPEPIAKLAGVDFSSMSRRLQPHEKRAAAIPFPYVQAVAHKPEVHAVPAPRPKVAALYALSKEGRHQYPIDTLPRLERAIDYFKKYASHFSLADRREFATKVASRACAVGMCVPDSLLGYVGVEPDVTRLSAALLLREKLAQHDSALRAQWKTLVKLAGFDAETTMDVTHRNYRKERTAEAYEACIDALSAPQEKRASARVDAETMVKYIEAFDRSARLDTKWDRDLPNPVRSVYKTAEVKEEAILWDEQGERLDLSDLTKFLRKGDSKGLLLSQFDDRLVEGLFKDPEQVFKSLPDPHKQIIARLACSVV